MAECFELCGFSLLSYEERVFIEAHSVRSQRALLFLVNPTDVPQTGYCNVGASSLDVIQLILVPRTQVEMGDFFVRSRCRR
jgi:hypothetical protein